MAKKKSKKNTQKQVETRSPPEASKTTPATAETPAPQVSVESQSQLPASPSDTPAIDEATVERPTSVSDPPAAEAQDTPSTTEPATAIQEPTVDQAISEPEIDTTLPAPVVVVEDPAAAAEVIETPPEAKEESSTAPSDELPEIEPIEVASIEPTTFTEAPTEPEDASLVNGPSQSIASLEGSTQPDLVEDQEPGVDEDPVQLEAQDPPTVIAEAPAEPAILEQSPPETTMGTAISEEAPVVVAPETVESATEAEDASEVVPEHVPEAPETPEAPEPPPIEPVDRPNPNVPPAPEDPSEELPEISPDDTESVPVLEPVFDASSPPDKHVTFVEAPEPPTAVPEMERTPTPPAEAAPEPPAESEALPAAPEPPVESEVTPAASEPPSREVILEQPNESLNDAPAPPVVSEKENAKQRRKRETEERKLWEEQERLEQERFEQERIQLERDEMKRIEEEQERLREERLENERLACEQAEKDKLEEEKRQQAILEERRQQRQEQLEEEKRQQAQLEQEREDQERLQQESEEQERVEKEAVELSRLEQEAEAAHKAAEQARMESLEAAAAASRAESEPVEEPSEPIAVPEAPSAPHSKHDATKYAPLEPAHLTTPPPEPLTEPPVPASVRAVESAPRLPTPAASASRTGSPHSEAAPAPGAESRYDALPAPKPGAVNQILEDNRPPAPSPPVGRMRARHAPAFDSDDDSDTSALVRPRRHFRGGEHGSRDMSSGSMPRQGYPPEPAHHRSAFASRVPQEPEYSHPLPPQPPNYHPRYYPQQAPPYYSSHNHGMTQAGYQHPSPYGSSSHSSSSPYTDTWGNYPPGYPHNNPPQRHDTLVSRDYPLGLAPLRTGSGLEDDPGEVFSRIAQAIPDLHVLLARYKETHGQLSVREELLRRAGIEQDEKLRAKDDEIADLKEKTRSLENKYSSEASRLRMHIGNLEEQAKELQQQRLETEKFKKEALETKTALELAMKSWEAKFRELEEAHVALQRTSAEEKAKAWADFEEWKSTYTTRNDAEKIALAIQFDKRLKEASVAAEDQLQEVAAAHVQEKEELRSEHQRQQLERQDSFERVRNELEGKLATVQKDHEEALKHERQSREVWLAEREALIKSHQDDRDSLRKGWDEQRDLLEAQFKKGKDESDKAWIELHADASRRADEEKVKADQLVREKEELMKKYNELKAGAEQEKNVIRSVAANLESEKSRLEKLMECYGDIAEIKSKGDTYYLVSFSQLQKQIIDLAATHFMHLPVRPPSDELSQVPSNLPSFLGDTSASRQVRAAYVAHTVSKLITYRVFGPFLFSLGRRYDKADSLFSSMSNHIRDKSTRKEAIWRQQTLLAAFTSSGAKQRINTAAGTVVEEIVGAIKHFADPREEEGIKIAVKRIVKLAAETWRFARLEREMINATMPALHDEEHQFTGPEFWPSYESYKPEGTLIGSLVDAPQTEEEKPLLLLRLFPVIWREPKHENFHVEGEKPDEGCIYHNGLALYDDAESVVQRMEELRSAGLPSYTTASPTIAEDSNKFPPPIVPPPREALPPPPGTAETTESPTKSSRPPSPTVSIDRSSKAQEAPPPPPSSIRSLELPTPAKPVEAYKRPPPGPIDFASPRDLIGLPLPLEGMAASQAPSGMNSASIAPSAATQKSMTTTAPLYPPPPPPEAADEPAQEDAEERAQPTPAESAIIPSPFPEPSSAESGNRNLPTPPHSRSGSASERPISPLFEAIDEIEALQTHRSRQPSMSSRRKSTHSRRSNEELPDIDLKTTHPDTSRRTSGYALSTRSAKTVDTEKTDRTERTDKTAKTSKTDKTERDPKSRYLCESRSAAVKGLYPNSPLAGQTPSGSTRNSVSSSKKKDRDSKELKRERSIPDNGTWDTSSSRTSDVPNTQLSTG